MLRTANGLCGIPSKALTTNCARRFFSSSVNRSGETKATKGIPLALDLGGIHIPKPGQTVRSLAARLQARKVGSDVSLDIQAPILPVSDKGPGQIKVTKQNASNQRLRQSFAKGEQERSRPISGAVNGRQKDGKDSRHPVRRKINEERPTDDVVSQSRPTVGTGSRKFKAGNATADSINARSQQSSNVNQRKPMLQKTQASPNRPQRRPQQTGSTRPGVRNLGRGRTGQPSGTQSRRPPQKRVDRKAKRVLTTMSKRSDLPTDPALNDYTGKLPVRKYNDEGLLVLSGQHAQLSQPIIPKVTSFALPTPRLISKSDPESEMVPGLVVSSYAGRAIPEAASKQVGGGLDIMDNAKLALCRVRDLRSAQRVKAIQLVQNYVGREKEGSAKVKL